MSLVQGGSANVPFKSHAGVTIAATSPINVDTTVANASTPVPVVLTADYVMSADGGALSRPSSCILASQSFPYTAPNGLRLMLSLCEARALVAAGAARFG